MASSSSRSKRSHWPSMFKSKPCKSQHQQLQHEHAGSDEERSSGVDHGAKARWNPKAEQIRILEGIFNSGMVNPPREEIRKIRAELQEYGPAGDANVFYWFQNRKSRTKHKLRHLLTHHHHHQDTYPYSSPKDVTISSPLQIQPQQNIIGPSTTFFLTEIMNHPPPTTDSTVPPTGALPSPITPTLLQGVGEAGAVGPSGGAAKSTVFINDVAFEVGVGPFNVREAFGDDVVLIHASGQPVLTNQWGVTLQSLQHGAFYYLI